MTTRGLDRAFPLENPRSTRQLGLTIREYVAVRIAAGLVAANPDLSGFQTPIFVANVLILTDELLAALGDTPEEP